MVSITTRFKHMKLELGRLKMCVLQESLDIGTTGATSGTVILFRVQAIFMRSCPAIYKHKWVVKKWH